MNEKALKDRPDCSIICNDTRAELEKAAMCIINALLDEQLLKIMEELK